MDRMIEYGDRKALINAETGDTLTYSQLAQQTVDVALSLARIGVRKGDVVSICSEKRMEVIATMLGVFCVGATYAPTDITFGTVPLVPLRVQTAKPKVMFCSPAGYDLQKASFDLLGCIEKYIVYGDEKKDGAILFKDFLTETAKVSDFVPTPVDGWKDALMIVFSSGTTGLPKGVPWTHLGFLVNSACYQKCLKFYLTKILLVAPKFVNDMIKSPILDQYDVTSVEMMLSSSSPIMSNQIIAVKRRFANLQNLFQIYGTTESGNSCNDINAPPLGTKNGSVGTPSIGFVYKVVDEDTREPLGPNQRGEICFKSPCVTLGYIGVDNSNLLDSEGFFATGDIGYYDDDKYFFVINRLKEMMKYNDSGVSPGELESILIQHPAVRDAGVTGAPDPECGEIPTGFVVLQPGVQATEKEITDYVNARITFRMKLAGGVRFVKSVPRGPADKIDRKALKLLL